jgi:hypothetical protein
MLGSSSIGRASDSESEGLKVQALPLQPKNKRRIIKMKVLVFDRYEIDESDDNIVCVYDISLFEDRKKVLIKLLKDHVCIEHFRPMCVFSDVDINDPGFEWKDIPNLPKGLQGTALEILDQKDKIEKATLEMKKYLDSIEKKVNKSNSDEDLKVINDELNEKWGILSLYSSKSVAEVENID